MSGDALARGAKFATFGPAKCTQEKWDAIWGDNNLPAPENNLPESRSKKFRKKCQRKRK